MGVVVIDTVGMVVVDTVLDTVGMVVVDKSHTSRS
jgi:hypothetical protein